jgi:bloom syndrome protein
LAVAAKNTILKQNGASETKPGPSRRISSPEFGTDFADFDDDDLEYMDLTRTTGVSDESLEFGDDVKVWTEKDASWEAPLPQAKKRKSADTGDAAAESQFPDVYQLLGADPPAPTRSVKNVRCSTFMISVGEKFLLLNYLRPREMDLLKCPWMDLPLP